MSFLKIEEKYITNIKDFEWGDKWRALTISKEQRMEKDYYFAQVVKFYGAENNTFEYDIGKSSEEFAWIGRIEKIVGETRPDTDPESKTFGQRVSFPPEMEVHETIDSHGKTVKKPFLKKGKTIYDFTLPVNEKNTEKIKTLIGPLTVSKQTTFQIIAGNEPPVSITRDVFFGSTVQEVMAKHLHLIDLKVSKKDK